MDLGPIGGIRHNVRLAAFSSEILLYQAEVNLKWISMECVNWPHGSIAMVYDLRQWWAVWERNLQCNAQITNNTSTIIVANPM